MEVGSGLAPLATRPILGVYTGSNPAVETRPRPLVRTLHQPVLHRVVVDVVEVVFVVLLIFERMLPKLWLPHAASPITAAASGLRLLRASQGEPRLRELLLDPCPTPGVLIVARRQRPDGMKMVGQQHNGVDHERPSRSARSQEASQQCSCRLITEKLRSPVCHQREEERSAGNIRTSPVGHGITIAETRARPNTSGQLCRPLLRSAGGAA